MKLKSFVAIAGCAFIFSCAKKEATQETATSATVSDYDSNFVYVADEVADLQILRYQIPGFNTLTPKQKELVYYLYQAALSGRDIIYDQNYKHNLLIRKMIEQIHLNYQGDKKSQEWQAFVDWSKRFWFSNGLHHHYSTEKFIPNFTWAYFTNLVNSSPNAQWPLSNGETIESVLKTLEPVIMDPKVDAKRVNLDAGTDLIAGSANNYYFGVTQKEAEAFYSKLVNPKDSTPPSWGLNSQLAKVNGTLQERVWKVGGMYGAAIEKIVYWLTKASEVAENAQQKKALDLLIEFYKTGDLKKFDEYNIAWVADTASRVDVVNGFIEVYGDPKAFRAAYESVVSIKDMEASKRIANIASQAQWFEDNSPILPEHKKKTVKGVSAKVITTVVESGDAAPATPIGINLPNANWIRSMHGSKSVSLGNIVEAYDQVKAKSGTLEEFAYSKEEIERGKKFGVLAAKLHTDMHEVIGHASGQIEKGVGTPKETLKNYASTLEEARADLVALYYILDEKLVQMGVMPSTEVGMAEYEGYIRNGLMLQLFRIEPNKNIEEAHMRNRAIVARWVFEKGAKDNVIQKITKEGKTFFVINDYAALRKLFGELLKEIQRIISKGDYKAGMSLVENYGVKVDQSLLKEVKDRYSKLSTKPYSGFIQPKLVAVEKDGKITDVKVEYPKSFLEQMLEYGKDYGLLPVKN